MTPRTARWSPYQLIVDGHFARPDDLTDAAKTLSRAHGGAPIIVATFSAYYLLPSLSRICGVEQVHDAGQALEGLRQELETTLRSGGPAAVIRSCAKVFLEYCGQLATTKLFGAGLDRPGDLMVAISCPASAAGLLESDGARYVVTSALGSRNAAFHRENALDLSVARRVKEASSSVEHEQAPGADDELNAIASSVLDLQTENLIALALRTLPAEAIVTYDVDGTDLRLRYRVGEVAASLRPDRRPVDPSRPVPGRPPSVVPRCRALPSSRTSVRAPTAGWSVSWPPGSRVSDFPSVPSTWGPVRWARSASCSRDPLTSVSEAMSSHSCGYSLRTSRVRTASTGGRQRCGW
jgi:hypothetical protein